MRFLSMRFLSMSVRFLGVSIRFLGVRFPSLRFLSVLVGATLAQRYLDGPSYSRTRL